MTNYTDLLPDTAVSEPPPILPITSGWYLTRAGREVHFAPDCNTAPWDRDTGRINAQGEDNSLDLVGRV